MPNELSERARRYMQAQTRYPHVEDLGLVRAALEAANVPVTDPVLDFHRTFAGYQTSVPGEDGLFGIIHQEVGPRSFFEPMEVAGDLDSDPPSLACADIHESWEMMIDLDGTFYCNGPVSSSYFLYTEQQAFLWEFIDLHKVRGATLEADQDELTEVLVPRLASARVEELSDEYGQVFATDHWVANVCYCGHECHVWVADAVWPPELTGFRSSADKNPRSLAELASDLSSKYRKRRYSALCELRKSTDPAVIPLLISAVSDPILDYRITAMQALSRLKAAEAIPSLAQIIRENQTEMLVLNAVMALASIGGPATIAPLVEVTHHPKPFLRRDAAIALGRIGDRSVIPVLESLLGDSESPAMNTGLCPRSDPRPIAEDAWEAIAKIRGQNTN